MRLIRWLSQLNLFESNAIDDYSIKLQRRSTRVYIIVLLIALLLLSIYGLFRNETTYIEIQNPTINVYEQLQDRYTLECPCSDVSISFQQIVGLVPTYHEICFSDFVTQRWFEYLFDVSKIASYFPVDFRTSATYQFQLLAILCRLSIQAIEDGLRSFFDTEFITRQLLSKSVFSVQVQTDIDNFKLNAPNEFSYSLDFLRHFLISDALLPATETMSIFYLTQSINQSWFARVDFDGFVSSNYICNCYHSPMCNATAGFFGDQLFDKQQQYIYLGAVDGWVVACYPIDGLLLSTLKSFYNQTELNSIVKFFKNSSDNFTSLDPNKPTRFNPHNVTIQTIAKECFVETWVQHINYSSYFNNCAPKVCAYTVNQRFDIFYTVTTIFGIYSGLTMVLRLVIPMIISFLFRKKNEASNIPKNTTNRLRKFVDTLLQLNLFKSARYTTPHHVNQQRWYTRVYFILFSAIVIILTLYTAINVRVTQIDLAKPSLNIILDLQKRTDISSLQCPCSKLSSPLKNFVKLTPIYHEICSSDFITEAWIVLLTSLSVTDFNEFGAFGPVFRLLQTYCDLAHRTISNGLNLFNEVQFLSNDLLTPDLFESHMRSESLYFQITTPNEFSHLLVLMREIVRVSQFTTGTATNFALDITNKSGNLQGKFRAIDGIANDTGYYCSSIINSNCKRQSILRNLGSYLTFNTIPVTGFYSSKYSSDTLFFSDLRSLYVQSFISTVVIALAKQQSVPFTALSRPSNFSRNTRFESLTNNLFIEYWIELFNYTAYYESCQPLSCTYTIRERLGLVSIIATVIGLVGGLSAILRLLTPYCVDLVLAFYRRQVQPKASQVRESEGHFIAVRVRIIRTKILNALFTLNLFENVDKPNPPEHELIAQRLWTRVYLLVLAILLSFVIIFTLFSYQPDTTIINKPTLKIYNDLPSSVDCPCILLSIPYYTFVNINQSFHDVCSSDFVNQDSMWTFMLFKAFLNSGNERANISSFSRMSLLHFQALKVLCTTANRVVHNQVALFLNSSLTSARMMELDQFQNQINAAISNLLSDTIPSRFMHQLELVRGISSRDSLVSAFGTNWQPLIHNETSGSIIYLQPQQYNGSSCNCATSADCMESMMLTLKSGLQQIVPGMLCGCLSIDSLLKSTLEGVYNQTCLDLINESYNFSTPIMALDANGTHFHPINATTINSIAAQLFVERWSVNISFESYFNACQPNTCSYTFYKRFNVLYVVSIFLTFYGGARVILTIVIPIMVPLVHKCLRKSKILNT